VIADAARALVVAGVMGGENSGVDESTTSIVLESAIFKAASIRWTSRSLGLSTDSSYRYERGVDPHSALEAARRAIDLIMETAGGASSGRCASSGATSPGRGRSPLVGLRAREAGLRDPRPEMRGRSSRSSST
jgi:phenylalanyl-tRNA synthetase beta chain